MIISAIFIFNVSNAQWIDCSLGIINPVVYCINKSGQYIFIGTANRGVYRSSNNGVDWEYKSNGMGPKFVQCLYVDGTDIYAGTISSGLYYSSDYGESWIARGFNYPFGGIYAIGKSGQNILLSNKYYSTNKGISWSGYNLPSGGSIHSFANLGDTVFLTNGNIYYSFDFGVNWYLKDSTYNTNYENIFDNDNVLYVSSTYGRLYKSTNRGNNWILFNQGIPNIYNSVEAFEIHNGVLYIAYPPRILYYSQTNSQWMPTNYVYSSQMGNFRGLLSFGNILFTAMDYPCYGLFYTSNEGANWNKTRVFNYKVTSLYNFNNKFFACSDSSGFYSSTNNGDSWICDKLPNSCFTSMTELNSNIYLASADSGIYKSTNNGVNWVYSNNDIPNRNVLSLNKKGANVYAGTSNGLFYSNNSGTNWLSLGFNSKRITAIGVTDSLLLIGTNTGLYLSTNNGSNWSIEYISGKNINIIKKFYNNIYAGTNNGLYCSSNNGSSWLFIGLNNSNVNDVIKYTDSALFSATSDGMYQSNSNGVIWTKFYYEGKYSFLDFDNYVYCGGYYKITKVLKSYLIIGINNLNENIISDFNLIQNYPNPFNPLTKIKYDVPKASDIRIVIYDINGREIELLVNQKYTSGKYEVIWDASKYPSGIYFCKLKADNFNKTIKMLLIK